MRFWDSSALVPLIVVQPTSAAVDQWLAADAAIAVWTLTSVELASAVARLLRERSIDDSAAHETEVRIDQLLGSCHTVIDVEAVKAQARRPLRVRTRSAEGVLFARRGPWLDLAGAGLCAQIAALLEFAPAPAPGDSAAPCLRRAYAACAGEVSTVPVGV